MNENDDWGNDVFESDEQTSSRPGKKKLHANGNKVVSNGSWHSSLTIVCFLTVAAVSFISAYLMKDIDSRPSGLLALLFALPVATLMVVSLLMERNTRAMTGNIRHGSQIAFAVCSVVVAAVVGFSCQVTNKEAKESVKIPVGSGWSDTVIILDKSGSMYLLNRDTKATKAVKALINRMDDNARVGMVVDVGWEENNEKLWTTPLSERIVQMGKLDVAQRNRLMQMADFELGANENFPRAFDVAYDMITSATDRDTPVSIIMLTDGLDCTGELRANNYIDKFNEANITVYYIHVIADVDDEVQKIADATSGKGVYVTEADELLDEMTQMIETTVYRTVSRDALRDIDQSNTAKLITGILLAILGLLIGISLTVMLSLSGQKRFQLILSPVMALLSFALLAFGKDLIPTAWIREAIAFSLLGVVLMNKNYNATGQAQIKVDNTATEDEW